MAKIASSFKCIVCQENLKFPDNTQITDFMILILQFYKNHDVCEHLSQKVEADLKTAAKKTRKRKAS